jgi:hypothetical protein
MSACDIARVEGRMEVNLALDASQDVMRGALDAVQSQPGLIVEPAGPFRSVSGDGDWLVRRTDDPRPLFTVVAPTDAGLRTIVLDDVQSPNRAAWLTRFFPVIGMWVLLYADEADLFVTHTSWTMPVVQQLSESGSAQDVSLKRQAWGGELSVSYSLTTPEEPSHLSIRLKADQNRFLEAVQAEGLIGMVSIAMAEARATESLLLDIESGGGAA